MDLSAVCTLARALLEHDRDLQICGFDNFIRPGSEGEIELALRRLGVSVHHVDVRSATDVDALPPAEVVIDAAANPSVLAGVDGLSSSRQVVEHNLIGTINLLEYCRRHASTFILLSTSRVYSIAPLENLPIVVREGAFAPDTGQTLPPGLGPEGCERNSAPRRRLRSTAVRRSLPSNWQGSTGETFGFPVWINRCGVLAGAGQFGRSDQGIFSFWINSWLRSRPLKYIGFEGRGFQTRDCLHPRDLAPLLRQQWSESLGTSRPRVVNVSGGAVRSMSLAQLSDWCEQRFGAREVGADAAPRPFDLPWMVLDSSLAMKTWNWVPATSLNSILEEIARHAEANEDWLEVSQP